MAQVSVSFGEGVLDAENAKKKSLGRPPFERDLYDPGYYLRPEVGNGFFAYVIAEQWASEGPQPPYDVLGDGYLGGGRRRPAWSYVSEEFVTNRVDCMPTVAWDRASPRVGFLSELIYMLGEAIRKTKTIRVAMQTAMYLFYGILFSFIMQFLTDTGILIDESLDGTPALTVLSAILVPITLRVLNRLWEKGGDLHGLKYDFVELTAVAEAVSMMVREHSELTPGALPQVDHAMSEIREALLAGSAIRVNPNERASAFVFSAATDTLLAVNDLLVMVRSDPAARFTERARVRGIDVSEYLDGAFTPMQALTRELGHWLSIAEAVNAAVEKEGPRAAKLSIAVPTEWARRLLKDYGQRTLNAAATSTYEAVKTGARFATWLFLEAYFLAVVPVPLWVARRDLMPGIYALTRFLFNHLLGDGSDEQQPLSWDNSEPTRNVFSRDEDRARDVIEAIKEVASAGTMGSRRPAH